MKRYVLIYAEVDYTDRLLMTNILPLAAMLRKYTDIALFWKCLYGNYDVDVNVFVFSLMLDAPILTRLILDFLRYHICVVQTALNAAFLTE